MYRNIHLLFSDFDSVLWLHKRIHQGRETHKYHATQMFAGERKESYILYL